MLRTPRKSTRIAALALAAVLPGAVAANGWLRLDAGGLAARIPGAEVDFDGAGWQRFLPSGRLLVRTPEAPEGQTSAGQWHVERDSLCTRWQGATEWDCAWVEVDGAGGVRFVDAYGNTATGRFLAAEP